MDFLDSVLVLGFGDELNQILLQVTLLCVCVMIVPEFAAAQFAPAVCVFDAALPAAPESDPQCPESAALHPACVSQPGMEAGCSGVCRLAADFMQAYL